MNYMTGLDWLRFYMCLFIAIFHFAVTQGTDNLLFLAIKSSGFYATSTFFILSGFILTYVYGNKIINNEINKGSFLIKRLSSFYPLHIILQFAFLFLFLASVVFLNSIPLTYQNLTQSEIFIYFLRSFFLLHAWDDIILFNQPSWSLSALIFFYIIFLFSKKLMITNRPFLWLSVVWVLYLIPALYFYLKPDSFLSYTILHINPLLRLPEFLSGILAFNIFNKYKDSINKNIFILIGFVGVLLTAVLVFKFPDIKILFHNGLVLPFQISLILGCAKITYSSSISSTFGSMSLVIFLIHSLILNITEFLFKGASVYSMFAINVFIIIVASYITLKLIVKPLQKTIRDKALN